jgi:gas vesicle protein
VNLQKLEISGIKIETEEKFMSDNRSNSGGLFVGGLLLGAAAGAIAGLLFAPKTGQESRKLIKKSADALPELVEDLSVTAQVQAERLSESALRNWDSTLLRLRDAIAAGVEASQRQQELERPLVEFRPESRLESQPESRRGEGPAVPGSAHESQIVD